MVGKKEKKVLNHHHDHPLFLILKVLIFSPAGFNLHESGLRNKVDLRGMKCGSHLEFPQYYTCQLLAPYSVFKYCKVLLNTVKV